MRDRPFDWDEAVDEIARVIDEAAGGRAVLCGLSLGGYLAMDVAARYPDKVAGLVISGASAEPQRPVHADRRSAGSPRSWTGRRGRGSSGSTGRGSGDAIPPATWPTPSWPAGSASRPVRPPSESSSGATLRGTFAAYPGPSLILNGQLDLPFRLGERGFRKAARDARVVVIRRASHLANLDRPSAYSAALARFAAEVTTQTGGRPPTTNPIPHGHDPVRADPCACGQDREPRSPRTFGPFDRIETLVYTPPACRRALISRPRRGRSSRPADELRTYRRDQAAGGEPGLAEVRVGENETFESALRRFNKKIQQSGILAEARRREHYEKPSVKRKRKEAKRKKAARTQQG